jgi:CRP-like cAMP-binding protein
MNPARLHHFTPLEDLKPVLSILSKISFLGGVNDEQRSRIFSLLEVGKFHPGQYISKKGEQPSHIYIIRQGRVGLLIAEGSTEMKKREFLAGDCFGEAAFLAMNNNSASFVAEEECEIIVLSKQSLNLLRREDLPLFCILIMNLARELARKLQYTDHLLLRNEKELREPMPDF